MFRLAHVSDAHLGPLPDVSYRDLASKRIVGYVNWKRNRKKLLKQGVAGAIVADIHAAGVDHLAVTGDLVNLALDSEIELARIWLETLGKPDGVSVVPGNHDAYVPGAFDKVCVSWGPWMTGDEGAPPRSNLDFPYRRIRDKVALFGVTTARATAPFMASGYYKEGQAERLGALLGDAGAKGLFRIVLIHHPPVRQAVPQHKRLFGIARFHDTMARHGAELVIHGHSHIPSLYRIGSGKSIIPVVGVGATGQSFDGVHPPAQWNLIEVEGEPGDWTVSLTRRGLTGPEHEVGELARVNLIGEPGRTGVIPAAQP